MILEDRRIRMNYWASIILHNQKPIEKFSNPNLLNINPKVDRNDIKNPYFTLSRTLPISMTRKTEAKSQKQATDSLNTLHFDYKNIDML